MTSQTAFALTSRCPAPPTQGAIAAVAITHEVSPRLTSATAPLRRHRTYLRRAAISISSSLFIVTGCCGVLTASQVQAVSAFASATNNYGVLPGSALNAYADSLVGSQFSLVVPAQNMSNEKAARATFDGLKGKVQLTATLKVDAERANNAFGALDSYSKRLSALTSDQFTQSLDQSATNLGQSINSAIQFSNKNYGTSLSPLGSTVAEGVRAAGGIYIRHKQEEYLKEDIKALVPAIDQFTGDVQHFMNSLISNELQPEIEQLENQFAATVVARRRLPGPPIGFDLASAYAGQLSDINSAIALAQSASSAAKQYALANHALANAIEDQQVLPMAIQEIQALEREVNAGKQLKSQMDSKK